MAISKHVHSFFFPRFNRGFLLRVLLLAALCWLTFSFLLIPLRIHGQSMTPTYKDSSFALCWRPKYLFSQPRRGDIVTVRFAGKKVMLLKRIIGIAGDSIEFRNGRLYVNKERIDEPHVVYQSNWNLPERQVKPDHVYVVGDNRSTAMNRHEFGQVRVKRIVGGVFP